MHTAELLDNIMCTHKLACARDRYSIQHVHRTVGVHLTELITVTPGVINAPAALVSSRIPSALNSRLCTQPNHNSSIMWGTTAIVSQPLIVDTGHMHTHICPHTHTLALTRNSISGASACPRGS